MFGSEWQICPPNWLKKNPHSFIKLFRLTLQKSIFCGVLDWQEPFSLRFSQAVNSSLNYRFLTLVNPNPHFKISFLQVSSKMFPYVKVMINSALISSGWICCLCCVFSCKYLGWQIVSMFTAEKQKANRQEIMDGVWCRRCLNSAFILLNMNSTLYSISVNEAVVKQISLFHFLLLFLFLFFFMIHYFSIFKTCLLCYLLFLILVKQK